MERTQFYTTLIDQLGRIETLLNRLSGFIFSWWWE